MRDIIAKVDAETMDELKTIVRRIERTDKVKSTRVVLNVGSIIQNAETDRKMESQYFAAMYCSKHGWIKFEYIDMRLNHYSYAQNATINYVLVHVKMDEEEFGERKRLWETRDKLIKKPLSRTVENGGLHRV